MEGLIELFCWCGERESLLLLFIDEINEAMWAVRPAPNQLRHFIHCAAPFTLLHWMKCWLAAQRGCLVGRSIKPFSFRSIQIQELKFFSFELPLKKRMFDFTIFWISCAACWIGIESCFWLRSLSLAEPLAVPPPLTHQRKRSQQLSSSNSTSFFHSNNFTSFNCFRSFTHSASLFISFSIRRGRPVLFNKGNSIIPSILKEWNEMNFTLLSERPLLYWPHQLAPQPPHQSIFIKSNWLLLKVSPR